MCALILFVIEDYYSIFLLISLNVEKMDTMSGNLSTMPGCAGTLVPIEAWIRKGHTCMECAWENYCIEYLEHSPNLHNDQIGLTTIEVHEPTLT